MRPNLSRLSTLANTIRRDIIEMLVAAGSGHSAGPLDLAEIFTALYFHVLRHNPKKQRWPQRDRLFLSCGHVCPVRYAAMIRAGYLPASARKTLRKFGSKLQGHPALVHWEALEHSSGPLGQGISVACGAALADKMDGKKNATYCIISDGELQEGQVWEALLFASKYRLSNLTVILDRNNIQIDGPTEEIMPLEPVAAKFTAFGWHVQEIDGHNIGAIIDACSLAAAVVEKPSIIIAHTIAGKGVPFMEYDFTWHGKPPKPDEARVALSALRSLGGKIRGEHE